MRQPAPSTTQKMVLAIGHLCSYGWPSKPARFLKPYTIARYVNIQLKTLYDSALCQYTTKNLNKIIIETISHQRPKGGII
jgi:hypothetical protein